MPSPTSAHSSVSNTSLRRKFKDLYPNFLREITGKFFRVSGTVLTPKRETKVARSETPNRETLPANPNTPTRTIRTRPAARQGLDDEIVGLRERKCRHRIT